MIASYPTLSAKVLSTTRKTLSSGSALLFTGQMLGNFGAYIYHMIMARMMTPADYGALVTLTSLSVALTVVVRSTQAWAITSASSSSEANGWQLRRVLDRLLRIALPVTALMVGAFWLISPWAASLLRLADRAPIVLLGLFVCTSSLVSIPKGILLGVQRLHFVSLMYILNPLIRVLSGFAFVVIGWGVAGGVAAYAAGDIAIFSLAMLALVPLFRKRAAVVAAADNTIEYGAQDRLALETYPILVLIINICLVALSTIDQLSVKVFFSPEVAGNFSVAFLLGRVVITSAMAMGWVVFAHASNNKIDISSRNRLLVKALAVIAGIAGVLLLGYVVMPDTVVNIMSGAKYKLATDYVGLVGIEVTLFSLIYIQAYYQMALRKMAVAWLLCLATAGEIVAVTLYHATVYQLMTVIIAIMAILLVCVSGMSLAITRDRTPPEEPRKA